MLEPKGLVRPAPLDKGVDMTIGLRGLLLVLAMILFIVAALDNDNVTDLLAIGLAVFAGAFIVDETGVARMLASRRRAG